MRFVVTGDAGFIGSAVCRYLITETTAEVVNVDKLTYAGNLNSLRNIEGDPRYRFLQANICDESALPNCLPTHDLTR
jgi:dTDP-glucose 4,6-dehydratase